MTNKSLYFAAVVLSISLLSSCGLYKKFEMPQDDNSLAAEYAKAKEAEVDTTTLGNLRWQEVFTDPVLVDLINQQCEHAKCQT